MNRSARKQHHEQARKKHKHDQQEHAREAARKPRSKVGLWALGFVVVLVLAFIVTFSLL